MKMRSVVLSTSLVLGLLGCGGAAEKTGVPKAPGPARSVRTGPVERVGAAQSAAAGLVRARQRATLASRLQASVVELPHREGESVAAGAVLVRLDDGALRAGVAAAETAMNVAAADLRRIESLVQKGAATPREREDAETRAAAAKAGYESARDGLSYAVLRAPFAGRLAARLVDVGDVVSPGAPLVELEGGAGLEVVAAVDAIQAAALAVGTAVQAHVDGQPAPVAARISALSRAADPATHRFEARAELHDAPGLRSGLFARLLVPTPGGAARLQVPKAALVRRGGLVGAFVVDGDAARLRWIAVGREDGDAVEVRAGLATGEKVVLEPGDLADGARIAEQR
jgi:RND family efflux transporter MFP subunit